MHIVLNPRAGRERGARLRAQIEREFPKATIWETRFAGHAQILACEAAQNGAKTVVAAGGDGTLCEVLNGLWPFRDSVKLGVLPVGTGNDFARTLGIGTDFARAVQTLQNGVSRRVDVGEIENSRGEKRRFLNVCGTGFDALVANRINAMASGRFSRFLRGQSAYLCGVARELWNLQSAPLELVLDGQRHEFRAVLCAVANARSYGGGMLVAPDAQIDDGFFDVILIENVSRTEFVRAFPGVFRGAHLEHPKVRSFRAKSVEIASPNALPVLVDGEMSEILPAKFQILPRAVEFLAPNG